MSFTFFIIIIQLMKCNLAFVTVTAIDFIQKQNTVQFEHGCEKLNVPTVTAHRIDIEQEIYQIVKKKNAPKSFPLQKKKTNPTNMIELDFHQLFQNPLELFIGQNEQKQQQLTE